MAGLGAPARWRHVVVGAAVLAGPALVLAGCLGRPLALERYDARQIVVQPAGEDGLRIRETVDQDFGSFDRHGYERRIPDDFGVPSDVEASSPDAPAAVDVEPDPVRANWTRIRVGDPNVTVSGQHRYVLSYTLPDVRLGGDGRLHLDIIDAGEPFPTDDFEVVVAGFELADPQCDVGATGSVGGCELVADGDVYRADIGRLETDQGVSISATVVARTEVAPPEVPPIPDRRQESSPVPLAALILPIGAAGAGGVYALLRRRGRNEVYAGGAADAAYGSATLPPPGAPPLPVRRVADERMGDLTTIEFVPPRGIAPWQGRVLVREQIDSDAASAWFSGLAAQDVLTIAKADDGDDHVVVAKGSRFDEADPTDAAILRPMFEDADALTLDGYDEHFAEAWSAALVEMRRSAAASGWWRRRAPGSRSIAATVALGVVGVVVLVFFLFVVVVLSLLLGPPGAIAFAIVVPAAVAFGLYRSMLPSRSAAGSALALRTESFRRFLVASEGRHVDWAWNHGLLREYSAWAVALGAADVWQRAMERSSVPPAELATGPLLLWSMSPAFSSGHTAPTSSGGGGWGGGGGGGFSGGVGGGGGGGSSGSW